MRRLWTGLLALAIVACGDSGTGPVGPEQYSLRSVNGLELPYKLLEVGETRLEVFSGAMTLAATGDATYALTLRVTTPEDEEFQRRGVPHYHEYFTQDASGRWALEGSNLRLTLGGSAVLLGVVDEKGITVSDSVRGVEGRNIDGNVVIAPADYSLTLGFRR